MHNYYKYFSLSFICLLWTLSAFTPAIAAPKIDYTLSMEQPHTHYFEVEMSLSDVREKYVDLKMATWTPGSYLIREFSKSVENFKAFDDKGKPLKFEKINKNTWRVYSEKAANFKVNYKVYAFEMTVRTSFLDADHGYVNGASVFMHIADKKEIPSKLTIKPYKEWKVISTALEPVSGKKFTYHAPDFDILVDSPIEIGNHEEWEFTAAGVPHKIAMYGIGNYNKDKVLEDMAKVVEACTRVFNVNPNKNYLFIVHNLEKGSGGLEHLNSTTLQVNRWTYSDNNYINYLSLVAHEYFHLWNVKRIRPDVLGPFNYEQESYTNLLWVSEGITSYYDELLLVPAGIVEENYFLNYITTSITNVENQPGSKVQSVAEASFDTWIKAYRPNENSLNTTISYYSKGAIIGALLDLEIINASNGTKNLDDVMRYLYNTYHQKANRGFSNLEFQKAVELAAGKNMNQFFQDHVFDTKTIDYAKYFEYAGLNFRNIADKRGDVSFGATLSESNGKLIVRNVLRNTSAYEGGINVEDEIIAIDGFRVNNSELNKIIGMKIPGDQVTVTVARDGKIKTLEFPLLKNPNAIFTISKVANPSSRQQMVYNKWMRK
jgi:predicted metalloprotease with PDZ domain